jgi:hypothetical protein
MTLPYTIVQAARRNIVVTLLERSVARVIRLLEAFSKVS